MTGKAWLFFTVILLGWLALIAGSALSIAEVDIGIEIGGTLAGMTPEQVAAVGLVLIGAVLQWVGASQV